MVIGIDAGHKNPAEFFRSQRKQTVILQQHDRLACSLKGCLTMFVAKTDFHGLSLIGIRMLEEAESELHFKYPAHGFIYASFRDTAFPDESAHIFIPIHPMHVHVHTGHDTLIKGFFQIFRSGMEVMDMLYVHPVADDKTFEPPFPAGHVLHQPLVRMARDSVQLVVCRHKGHRPGLDSGFEWREEHFPTSPLGKVGRRPVSPVYRLAAARKMFYAGQYVIGRQVALIALDRGRTHQ